MGTGSFLVYHAVSILARVSSDSEVPIEEIWGFDVICPLIVTDCKS